MLDKVLLVLLTPIGLDVWTVVYHLFYFGVCLFFFVSCNAINKMDILGFNPNNVLRVGGCYHKLST